MEYRICSLFAGIGGIDSAFAQSGFRTVYANEFDTDACKTYRYNFPTVSLTEADITKVAADDMPDFDVLVAGFPCQAFSVCGYKKGFSDPRGNLFFEICRILEVKKPTAVFLENVANLVKHDDGNTFNVICDSLTDLGYHVRYAVMDACDYGVPQHRTRTYIVCFRDKDIADHFEFPAKSELTEHITDILDFHTKAEDSLYLPRDSKKYMKMLAAIDDDAQVYRFSDYGIQKGKDSISFTLKANMGVWYDREPIIKDDFGIRKLSPKECLLLQGFPKEFYFPDIIQKSAYKQAGNTVCVPVVKQIADKMYAALNAVKACEYNTLVGVLKSRKQLEVCLEQKFYHFPAKQLHSDISNLQYCALNLTARIFGISGICYIGKISDIKIVPRNQIESIPKKSIESYYLLNIVEWEPLETPMVAERAPIYIDKLYYQSR